MTESNINEALQEIRRALLEADVNIDVVRDFIEEVRGECVGEAVLKSVTPGQMVIKIINDKLTSLLGDGVAELDIAKKPSVVMLVGLHGSGKTTTCAKLAMYLKNQMKKSVLMVAADVYRPAAIDQLKILGEQIKVPVYAERTSVNLPAIVHNAVEQAKTENIDTVLIDTAGRLQIDDFMIQELVRLQQVVYANEVLLVADSALGQEAVAVADKFNKAMAMLVLVRHFQSRKLLIVQSSLSVMVRSLTTSKSLILNDLHLASWVWEMLCLWLREPRKR